MKRDSPFDDDITTVDEFDDALGRLLSTAARNGIDPRGTWEYRGADATSDLEVMIVELEERE